MQGPVTMDDHMVMALEIIRTVWRYFCLVGAAMPVLHLVLCHEGLVSDWSLGAAVVRIVVGSVPLSLAASYSLCHRFAALDELKLYYYAMLPGAGTQPIYTFLTPTTSDKDVLSSYVMCFATLQTIVAVRIFLTKNGARVELPLSFHVLHLAVFVTAGLWRATWQESVQWFMPTWFVLCSGFTVVTTGFAINTQALIEERGSLQKAQGKLQQLFDAQHSMWRSVFDASCTCRADGCITLASPHLQDLLGGPKVGSLVGKSLADFVAETSERQRLLDFMQAASRSAQHQAATIQSTLTAWPRPDLDGDGHSDGSLEVKLFAISLAAHDEGGSDLLQIGVQVLATVVPPEVTTKVQDLYLAETLSIPFDSGSDRFRIKLPNSKLRTLMTGRDQLLMDWMPSSWVASFSSWVCEEVQEAPVDASAISSQMLQGLYMRPPSLQGTWLWAERAWLQLEPPLEDVDDDDSGSYDALPASLQLSEVWLLGGEQAVADERPALDAITEDVHGALSEWPPPPSFLDHDGSGAVSRPNSEEQVSNTPAPMKLSSGPSAEADPNWSTDTSVSPQDSVSEAGVRHAPR